MLNIVDAESRQKIFVSEMFLDGLLDRVKLLFSRCSTEDKQRVQTLSIAEENIRFQPTTVR